MVILKSFFQRFIGSSIPTGIEGTDGARWVLKMRGVGNGTQSLLSEFLVNRSAVKLGLPVPGAEIVLIPQGFPWTFGTDEFDEIVQRSYGLNLGLEYLGPCQGLTADEIRALPLELRTAMATLDAFFLNYDRLPGSQNVLRDPEGRVWLIDHGSCLFLNPDFAAKPLALAKGHVLGEGINPLIDRSLIPELAKAAKAVLPDVPLEWLTATDLDLDRTQSLIDIRVRAVS